MFKMDDVIAAFSEDQVERLTGLSKARLRYWANTGFFAPSFVEDNPRLPFGRVYSFKDAVALRVLERLRVRDGVPLQHLRKVAAQLSDLGADKWTATKLWVVNRKVLFQFPDSNPPREVVSGQYILPTIELRQVIAETDQDIQAMRIRSPQAIGRIVRMQGVSRKAWVLSGTRIKVGSIRRLHDDGYTTAQIIGEYPDLTPDDVEAALRHRQAAA